MANLVAQTLHYRAQIKQVAQRQLKSAEQQAIRQLSQLQAQTVGQLTALQKDSDYAWRSIQQSAQRHVKQAARLTYDYQSKIEQAAYQQLATASINAATQRKIIMHSAEQQLGKAQRESVYLRDIVLLHRPERVLSQGYTMLSNASGKQTLTSSTQLYSEQIINIRLKDGQATAQILDVKSL